MFANCIDKNGENNLYNEKLPTKLCPYRVYQEEFVSPVGPKKTITTQKFYQCLGNKCIAYDNGFCLRLNNEKGEKRKDE